MRPGIEFWRLNLLQQDPGCTLDMCMLDIHILFFSWFKSGEGGPELLEGFSVETTACSVGDVTRNLKL